MATAALVDRDLEIGRKILVTLRQANIEVSVAFWAYVSQSSDWQFFIATPLVDSEGPKSAYERVLRTLHDAGMDPQLPWRRILLRSPKDPVLRSLEKQTEIPDGSISITEFGTIPRGTPSAYYVTYAPYPGETFRILNEPVGDRFVEDAYVYGKMWIATDVDGLRGLLLKLFRLNQDVVESTIGELSARKTASIPNVRLRARDLRRLRPA
jgi:hypothetical protein